MAGVKGMKTGGKSTGRPKKVKEIVPAVLSMNLVLNYERQKLLSEAKTALLKYRAKELAKMMLGLNMSEREFANFVEDNPDDALVKTFTEKWIKAQVQLDKIDDSMQQTISISGENFIRAQAQMLVR